jgi:RHS repeat-associated protein
VILSRHGINKYFEKTGDNVTTNYYFGSRLIAVRKITVTPPTTTLSYILQDHLGSTSGTSDSSGSLASTISYFSFGSTRSSTGTMPTDKKFTGQILDTTGLYYYGARYYDPGIGRFISADTIVQNLADPQTLNRYSYVLNNPLNRLDPSGHWSIGQFGLGLLDSLGNALKSSCVPYMFYENCAKPIYQLCTNQMSWEEYGKSQSFSWEDIKSYYNLTDARGQGRVAGDLAILVLTWKACSAGKTGVMTTKSATITADIRKFTEYAFTDPSKKYNFTKLGYSIEDSAKLRSTYMEQAGVKIAKGDYRIVEENYKWTENGVGHTGTRIEIDIEIPGKGEAVGQLESFNTGWMIYEDGSFGLTAPFSGHSP